MRDHEVPNAGTPRVAYTHDEVVAFVRRTIGFHPDERMVAAKSVKSLRENALYSADSLVLLGIMHTNEQAGMSPTDALEAALKEEKE